jgi:hypothetical protein
MSRNILEMMVFAHLSKKKKILLSIEGPEGLTLDPFLFQINLVHIIMPSFFKIHFNITSHLPGISSSLFLSGFPSNISNLLI